MLQQAGYGVRPGQGVNHPTAAAAGGGVAPGGLSAALSGLCHGWAC
jgi:hypothetical protein